MLGYIPAGAGVFADEASSASDEVVTDEASTSDDGVTDAVTDAVTDETLASSIPIWSENADGSFEMVSSLELGREYVISQLGGVKVVFSSLPEESGSLKIAAATQVETVDGRAVVGDVYEISSSMQDGSFVYDLYLPVPASSDGLQVMYSEDGSEYSDVSGESVEGTYIVSRGLDHFTFFVVVDPTVAVKDTSIGTRTWSHEENVYLSDNNRARVNLPGLAHGDQVSDYLVAKGFGLSIPSDATIEGITVTVERSVNHRRFNGARDYSVKLVKAGTIVGNDYADRNAEYPTSDTAVSYGSSVDLWGETWTPADLNDPDFGVAISAFRPPRAALFEQKARIDYIKIEVAYEQTPVNLGFNLRSMSATAGERPVDLGCGLVTNGDFFSLGDARIAHNWEMTGAPDGVMYHRQWSYNGGAWSSGEPNWTTDHTDYRTFGSSVGTEGVWNTRVRAWVDTNSNGILDEGVDQISDWSNECSVTLDRTKPVITFTDEVDGIPVANEEVSIMVTDDHLDPGTLKYTFVDDPSECTEALESVLPYPFSGTYASNVLFGVDNTSGQNGKYICARAGDTSIPGGNVSYQASANPLLFAATARVCKFDSVGNGLAGWRVTLLGEKVGTVTVYPDGNDYSSASLPTGDYVIVANGTYVYRPGAPMADISDANYSKRLPTDAVYSGPFVPWVNVNTFPAPHTGWLGIMVGGSATNWSDYYNDIHMYALGYGTHTGAFSFKILDNAYGDNSGFLTVDIYKGYAGTTGGDGCVDLMNVPFGNYSLEEVMQTGWEHVQGGGQVAVDEALEQFALVNRPRFGTIVAHKFIDENMDGRQDGGDANKEGWSMSLYEGGNCNGQLLAVQSTDSTGSTTFGTLVAGQYSVMEETRAGWTNSLDTCQNVDLTWDETEDVYFGNFEWGIIRGVKYYDQNMDGAHNSGEAYLSDWTIRRYESSWSTYAEMTTGSNGRYEFGNLPAGTYYVCEVLPEGWAQTAPSDVQGVANMSGAMEEAPRCRRAVVSHSGHVITGKNFGNFELGSISGMKYEDMRLDHQKDAIDPGVEGWTIELYHMPEVRISPDETIVTDPDGSYQFENLYPGSYEVCEVEQDGWVRTDPQDDRCRRVRIGVGDDVQDIDFGNYQPGMIQGRKFNDVNGNGVFDQEEKEEEGNPNRLDGWTVRLYRATLPSVDGWEYVDEMVTGDDTTLAGNVGKGQYRFVNLDEDTYYVCEVNQEGWTQTRPSQPETLNGLYGGSTTGVDNLSGAIDEASRCLRVRIRTSGDRKIGRQFGNYYDPSLEITKTNDSSGLDMLPGDYVTYTITVTAHESDVDDVILYDLPPKGFIVDDSSGSVHLSYVPPTYGTNGYGVWYLGTLTKGETATISYKAQISDDQEPGEYPDLAWAQGEPKAGDDDPVVAVDPEDEDNFVGTDVRVINEDVLPETGVVLGAATEVLAETGQSIFSIMMLVCSLFLCFFLWTRRSVLKGTRGLLTGGLVTVLGGLSGLLFPVLAASSIALNVEKPQTPTNSTDFVVSYVAFDRESRGIDVTCSYSYEGGAYKVFDTETLSDFGGSGNCKVDSSIIAEDGSYMFKVHAKAGSDTDEKTVGVDYDGTAPSPIVTYTKKDTGTCEYKITVTAASDSGQTTAVEIYRSEKTSFTADKNTYVTTIPVVSGETVSYTDTVPGCAEPVYYAVRAADDVGNVSAFTADEIVTVVAAAPAGGAGGAVVAGAATTEGEVAGEAAGAEGETTGATEEGTVLGEEDEGQTSSEGTSSSDENPDGTSTSSDEKKDSTTVLTIIKYLVYAVIVAGALTVVVLVYRSYRKSKT